jgi:hypothetical protein
MKTLIPLSLVVTGLMGIVIAAGGLVGCQTSSPSQYISPRITGRVLDAQTHQPIEGVTVKRIRPDQSPNVDQVPKGGQMMERSPAVRSGKDGIFLLDSERDLAFFRSVGWYSVDISFGHPGYRRLVKTYSLTNAINTASGEPWVKAGDILLTPRAQ